MKCRYCLFSLDIDNKEDRIERSCVNCRKELARMTAESRRLVEFLLTMIHPRRA